MSAVVMTLVQVVPGIGIFSLGFSFFLPGVAAGVAVAVGTMPKGKVWGIEGGGKAGEMPVGSGRV